MASLKQQRSSELSEADLVLLARGPWDPAAQCDKDRPLWDPRVQPERLRALWQQHQPAIEAAAAEAGLSEPWVVGRLYFTDLLDR